MVALTAERDSLKAQLKASKLQCQLVKSASLRQSITNRAWTGVDTATASSSSALLLAPAMAHMSRHRTSSNLVSTWSDLSAAIAAIHEELDVMRAPRVTRDPEATLENQMAAVVKRLRAWTRHNEVPSRFVGDVAGLWKHLKQTELQHEAVCGQLQRAKAELQHWLSQP